MKEKEVKPYQMIGMYQRIHNKFALIEKIPRDFGTGDPIHPSVIHTIEAIGKNKGFNVTELAQFMGITKAAVSQIVRKLEKKGFVEKYKANGNEKEVLLKLKKKGEIAFEGHELFHANMDKNMLGFIKDLSEEEYSIIKNLLNALDIYTDGILKERQ
jgi:DNA-binding MarR family transcriptional regulator